VAVSGQEHRFYSTAGGYTGVFWTTTAAEALAAVDRIDLIEARAFQAECHAVGSFVRLTLDAPRADAVPPPPPPGPVTEARP
jgi:hypothetical protein